MSETARAMPVKPASGAEEDRCVVAGQTAWCLEAASRLQGESFEKESPMTFSRFVAATSLIAIAGAAHAGKIPANIQLDGYCNTMTNIAPVIPHVSVGGRWYTCVTGKDYPAGGGNGRTISGRPAYFMTIDATPYGASTSIVVRADHTWALLDEDGSQANSGTWSPLTEGASVKGGKDVFAP